MMLSLLFVWCASVVLASDAQASVSDAQASASDAQASASDAQASASDAQAAQAAQADAQVPAYQAEMEALYNAKSYGNSPTFTVEKKGEGSKDVHPKFHKKFHLQYLALRGLGDLAAMILEYSGQSYKASYYGRKDFMTNIKPSLPFGRLPLLTVTDGKQTFEIAQSAAIERYLATEAGLMGQNSAERARIDMWYENVKELITASHSRWGKVFKIEDLKSWSEQDFSKLISFKDSTNGGEYTPFEKSYFAIKTFEDALQENKNALKTIAGTSNFSLVDLAIFRVLLDLHIENPTWNKDLKLPNLGNLFVQLLQDPHIKGYLESNRRMPKVEVKTEPTRDYHYTREPPVNVNEMLELYFAESEKTEL